MRASLIILATALGCAQKKMPVDDAAKSPTVDLRQAPATVAAAPTAVGLYGDRRASRRCRSLCALDGRSR